MSELIAAIVGGAIALMGVLFAEKYRRQSDRKGVASAIAGEIAAIIHGAEARQQVQNFQRLADVLKQTPPPPPPWAWRDAEVPVDPVLQAYISRIGELGGNLPERVARFYTILHLMRVDVRRLSGPEFHKYPLAAAALIESDLRLWNENTEQGKALVADLQRIATYGA